MGILWMLATWPVVATMSINYGKWGVEGPATLLMLVFCFLLLPEIIKEFPSLRQDRLARIAAMLILPSILAWKYFEGFHIFGNPYSMRRFWLYAAMPFFYLGARSFFEIYGASQLQQIYLFRLLAITFAILIISYFKLIFSIPETPWKDLPIYWHIRHMNYDLVIATGVLTLFLSQSEKIHAKIIYTIAFLVVGYYSAWSGGRGGTLAILMFFLLLWTLGIAGQHRRILIIIPMCSLLAGGIIAAIYDQSALFGSQFSRFMSESASGITSGRTAIWAEALHILFSDPIATFFGFGPDAVLRLTIGRWTGIAMAHNTIVQWLMEFGLLGTLPLVAILLRFTIKAFRIARSNTYDDTARITSALLLSLFAFSMTDGLLYHLAPMAMILMMLAYVSAQQRLQAGQQENSTRPRT